MLNNLSVIYSTQYNVNAVWVVASMWQNQVLPFGILWDLSSQIFSILGWLKSANVEPADTEGWLSWRDHMKAEERN